MAESFFDRVHKHDTHTPDVLSCLANLSNDEVFTPPEVANRMLDMLPQELFQSTETTFLDPACKTGVFLREIAKRLLAYQMPFYQDRMAVISSKVDGGIPLSQDDIEYKAKLQEVIDHIFHKQLFGIAITELTSMLSRRSVYCSTHPAGPYSVSHFDDNAGNILFRRIEHSWVNGKCQFCGATQSQWNRDANLETHAYEFIHSVVPERIFEMKFDVIISNPPYQLSDGGAQASAKPIYNYFVEQAKKMNPRYLSMIIPARWFAGGKGLDEFRDSMLTDVRIKELHDFPNTDDCFPGVNIRGGVCYFLWEKEYNNTDGKVKVVTHNGNNTDCMFRDMKYNDLDIFIRYGKALSILQKVMDQAGDNVMSNLVSSRKPFGLDTSFAKGDFFRDNPSGLNRPVPCFGKGLKLGYVDYENVLSHKEWIGRWKVFTSRANNIGTELNDDNMNTFIGKDEICTETYIVIGGDLNLSKDMAINLSNYLQTRFARFCHSLAKASQDATSKTYRFVPIVDFSRNWTDEELYQKYKLTPEEVLFIEEMIKPMDASGGDA